MTTSAFSPSRRKLLGSVPAAAAASMLAATGFAPSARAAGTAEGAEAAGPVTFYAELRVAQPNKAGFDAGMQAFAQAMQSREALAVTLKQMVGDSTMVKNYPASYKGVLRSAYLDGAEAGTLPLFYSLFVRFPDLRALRAAQADAVFDRHVLPHLHGMTVRDGQPVPSPQPMAVYRGVFETTLAGDRQGIYTGHDDLVRFLSHPVDTHSATLVTVENHVFLPESLVSAADKLVPQLLKVAQETYQPSDDANRAGLPGSMHNRNYRRAMSTEVLRKIEPDGQYRAYLLHGVWESVWDHENSHLDPRFQKAVAPVGAAVAIGPVEPFYATRLTVLKA